MKHAQVLDGAWLGIDVGSSKSKVLNFALIHAQGGECAVHFERGQSREAGRNTWPRCVAADFLDLSRASLLSKPVEDGVRDILARSELLKKWSAIAGRRGAAIDAPCGFASPEHECRETEDNAAASFSTPTFDRFVCDLQHFAQTRNETPLQQRYFWKLVGLAAFRGIAGATSLEAGFRDVTRACNLDMVEEDGTPQAPAPYLREAFPSDTYARANGALGLLSPVSRSLLAAVANAPWRAAGNKHGRLTSMPTPKMMAYLQDHRSALARELATPGAIPSMRKVKDDPSWADLWDALACAFVVMCEAHGASRRLAEGTRALSEGFIVAPATSRG